MDRQDAASLGQPPANPPTVGSESHLRLGFRRDPAQWRHTPIADSLSKTARHTLCSLAASPKQLAGFSTAGRLDCGYTRARTCNRNPILPSIVRLQQSFVGPKCLKDRVLQKEYDRLFGSASFRIVVIIRFCGGAQQNHCRLSYPKDDSNAQKPVLSLPDPATGKSRMMVQA